MKENDRLYNNTINTRFMSKLTIKTYPRRWRELFTEFFDDVINREVLSRLREGSPERPDAGHVGARAAKKGEDPAQPGSRGRVDAAEDLRVDHVQLRLDRHV